MKKFYLISFCLLLTLTAVAQPKKKKGTPAYNKQNKETDQFLQKQWWLGFKAGANLSQTVVTTSYNVISPTNYEPSAIAKQYDDFKLLGSQATLEVTFYYKGFSFSFQPTYQHSRFVYANNFSWTDDENQSNTVELKYEQEQKLDHAVLPLLIKYDLTKSKLRPYLQIGGYTALLLSANKSVTVSGTDYASGGTNAFENEPIIVGAKDLFAKNHWGLLGGAGVNYNVGNVRLNLDIIYRYGMSNIVSPKNRYGNDRLSGVGDALDDLTLNNLSVSIGCLFPMRFLASGFKSLDK